MRGGHQYPVSVIERCSIVVESVVADLGQVIMIHDNDSLEDTVDAVHRSLTAREIRGV